jgi:Leucine-rich repeat (LRR) protein
MDVLCLDLSASSGTDENLLWRDEKPLQSSEIEQLASATQLQRLSLQSRNFLNMPIKLAQYKTLLYLNLSKNKLVRLPNFGDLQHLQVLDVSGNWVSELERDGIGSLPRLLELNLSANNICERSTPLLEAFQTFTSLKKLNLSMNRFVCVPFALSKLCQLMFLDLSCNQIGTNQIGPVLSTLTNLRTLDLHTNRLKSLEGCLSALVRLQYLDVSSNQLASLTGVLRLPDHAASLKSLNLSNCMAGSIMPGRSLPRDLFALTSLTSLDLRFNHLKTLEWKNNCGKHPTCGIEGSSRSKSDNDISSLVQLQELDVTDNVLTHLPLSMCRLTCLTTLNLWRNNSRLVRDNNKNNSGNSSGNGNGNPILASLPVHLRPALTAAFLKELEFQQLKKDSAHKNSSALASPATSSSRRRLGLGQHPTLLDQLRPLRYRVLLPFLTRLDREIGQI